MELAVVGANETFVTTIRKRKKKKFTYKTHIS